MSGTPLPKFELKQTRYEDEIAALCALLEGPVLQIGARVQDLDAKERSWRRRLAAKGFVGSDIAEGAGVDAVFDLCGSLPAIEVALAPHLAGQPLRSLLIPHVLEHVADPFGAARNAAALLAPDGSLFVQVPWVQAYHGYPDDHWRFSLSGLRLLFPTLELQDAFVSGGSSDVAYRLWREGAPDLTVAASRMEASVFQILLSPEENRRMLQHVKPPKAYLSRGYLPAMIVNARFAKAR